MTDVFVSYAHPDRDRARTVVTRLRAEGLSVWFDENLWSGQLFRHAILDALHDSRLCLVLWSPASVGSAFVSDEADYAFKQGKLCPVMIVACEPPLGLRQLHYEDMTGDAFDAGLTRLVGVLRSRLHHAAIAPHEPTAPASGWKPPTIGVVLGALVGCAAGALVSPVVLDALELAEPLIPFGTLVVAIVGSMTGIAFVRGLTPAS